MSIAYALHMTYYCLILSRVTHAQQCAQETLWEWWDHVRCYVIMHHNQRQAYKYQPTNWFQIWTRLLIVADDITFITIRKPIEHTIQLTIQYSRKFSLVQIFADMPSRHLEEIFVILNFIPALDLVLANAREDIFRGFYFHSSRIICQNHEILYHPKISHYIRILH